jgi:poly(hydroxyalkanoate) granule-associated protein
MAKKSKTTAKSNDAELAEAVRASAHHIWQAGLGAFAKAQEEGGKVFAKLVKEGTDLQKRSQELAENKMPGVTDKVTKMAGSIGKQAAGSWDKLEHAIEDRVARSLASLGVSTKKDLQILNKQVEELTKSVKALSGKKPATTKAKAKAPAKKKATAKATLKTAVKKVSKVVAKKTVKKPVVAKAAPKTAVKKTPKAVAKNPGTAKKAAAKPATVKKIPSKKPVAAKKPAPKPAEVMAAPAAKPEAVMPAVVTPDSAAN